MRIDAVVTAFYLRALKTVCRAIKEEEVWVVLGQNSSRVFWSETTQTDLSGDNYRPRT